MSKMSKTVKMMNEESKLRRDEAVTNFMGGDSYVINPLDTLKMVMASSIFGEASYYRPAVKDGRARVHELVRDSLVIKYSDGKTTTEIMEESVDKALDYDFMGTLNLAVELRNEYNMRMNPQIIMVRAAIHPKRKDFSAGYNGVFAKINDKVMRRADEPMTQLSYYMFLNKGKKNNIPSILKRSVATKLSNLREYEVNKYKNSEIGMINAVRITHANSPVLDKLMHDELKVEDNQKTWETLRSSGMGWKEIFETTNMGHMALLRNLRGVFTEVDDAEFCKKYLAKLTSGVLTGKQFPFRYYSALKAVINSKCNHKPLIIDALEECMDVSIKNMPKLKGKTMCLSDNSGSAWGAITSEYGSVCVAEIDNLSSVITAACSDEGYVGKFGDKLKTFPITKRHGVLKQADEITNRRYRDVGGSTEGGIWKFFRDAIKNKEHWDNIFIYSDQQAGHGGLYGTGEDKYEYRAKYGCRYEHVNVFKLIEDYRKYVNPKVNVFSIQTAGYNNILIPEYAYRTNIMTGWTGKEGLFASRMIELWDEIENKNKQ